MLFNSIDFAIFLPIIFILYWATTKKIQFQNIIIILSSYVFYAWWDWRFLSLILFSTLVDYTIGMLLSNQNNIPKRKILLWISIFVNIGFLGFFKYFNFFLDNFITAFSFFGTEIKANSLNIILPVGISFYTFQTLSYTIDVYKRKLEPTRNFFAFTAFVSFFPQLVAGPIERATNLLPQFYHLRKFDYVNAVSGLRQILWGLFKKIVIADNCAEYTNIIFNNSSEYSGSMLAMGAIFFTFQIYCDFSGYSDIAIGTARLFGINLMRNFAFPYFSRDIAEFWRRWHISLSTWFRDYVYVPIGGSRGNKWNKIRNTFVVFIVSGFWHGANWTFIAWGTLHAVYFLPLLLLKKNRKNIEIVAFGRILPTIKECIYMIFTFALTVFAWIFFRAENIGHAISYIVRLFSQSFFSIPTFVNFPRTAMSPYILFAILIFFIVIEWIGREQQYAFEIIGSSWKRGFRYLLYYIVILSIFIFAGKEQEFIYFQF